MKQYNVGVIGATGMVGQRFITLLENHPWFNLVVLAASARSAGKTYEEAVGSRWLMKTPMPESVKKMVVLDAANVEEVAAKVDFVFCAVNMKKDEIKALEEAYAKAECPVVSNNSAHRFTPDVPMVVPEINADHIDIIPAQRKRLGTKRGFVAVKSNCSLQSYVPALHPLRKYGISDVLVCTYQAISGAGKTFETFPDILDNVIPYIGGEEEKSEQEPLKLWGHIEGDKIVSAESPALRPSACVCLSLTATWARCSCALRISLLRKKFCRPGRNSTVPHRIWSCPAPRSSSCITLRKMTARSPSWTVCWKTAWLSALAVCVRITSTTTSSSACPTTRCAALPAARCCWPSCWLPRAILTDRLRMAALV